MSLKTSIMENDFAQVEQLLTSDNSSTADKADWFNLFSQNSLAFPLHYLCRQRHVPLSTVKAMITASPPKAFVYRDSVGLSTPLHLAIWYKLPVDVILELLQASREATLMQDVDGNLPIHLAAALHPDADRLVPALLALQPLTVKKGNAKLQTPLHSLCTRPDISLAVLKDMVAVAPNAVGLKDRMGRLPIHHACLQQADLDVLQCLVEAYPQGVNVTDHAALTPYGIVRRRWNWSNADPRVRLLRKGMITNSRLPVALRNKLQFKLEDMRNVCGAV